MLVNDSLNSDENKKKSENLKLWKLNLNVFTYIANANLCFCSSADNSCRKGFTRIAKKNIFWEN
jgi:hypothetical protein